MEDKKQRRIRSTNFTPQEKDVLVSLVEKYSKIIESKETNVITWSQKNQMWEQIEKEFNSQAQTYRTVKNLKDKYENLKKETKNAIANERKEVYLTGGGCNKSKVTSLNERLASIMGKAGTGLCNNVDSDKAILDTDTTDISFEEIDVILCDANSEQSTSEVLMEKNENIKGQDIPIKDKENWASWNPNKLTQKRSEKLKIKRCNNDKSEDLLKKQSIFFENEDKRAEELHILKKQKLELKIELIKHEINLKKLQLDKFKTS